MSLWIIDWLQVDGLFLIGLTQRGTEERPDMNPVPKEAMVHYSELQHVNEEIAVPASKCALVNEKEGVDAISWVKWDTLNGRYIFSSCLLNNYFCLLQARSDLHIPH